MSRGGPPAAFGFAPRRLPAAQAFEEACRLHAQGDLAGAERLYQLVLKSNRDNFETLYRLAAVNTQQGKLPEAVKLVRRALQQRPNAPEIRGTLASLLLMLNRPREAIAEFRTVLAARPDDFEANANMAAALFETGDHEAAVAHCRRALAVRPDAATVYNTCGSALAALGRRDEAIGYFERALALAPNYAKAHDNLGAALLVLERYDEALVCFRRAVAADPQFVEAHSHLGEALHALDRYPEALQQFSAALAIRPDFARAHYGMGGTLLHSGQIDRAREAFRKAIASDPGNPVYYWALAGHTGIKEGDPAIAGLEKLAADPGALTAQLQIHLHFALAKVYADVAQPQRAEPHLLAGNALKRQQVGYDEAAELEALDAIRRTFTPELMRAGAGAGDPSQVPVFVLGMPRSGSTLIEQILASHSQVFAAGERADLQNLVNAACAASGKRFAELAATLDGAGLRRLGADYLARITATAPGMPRIIDKMPDNFRYVGLIHLALPNARIIHTLRDPIDTCLSCFAQLFSGNIPYAYDPGELARFYRAYRRLMQHWQAVLPPGVMLDVSYEAVVADLDKEARRIVAHCGLPWEDACLDFHRTARVVKTASAAQVRQPLYRGAVGRGRGYPELVARLSEALEAELPQA